MFRNKWVRRVSMLLLLAVLMLSLAGCGSDDEDKESEQPPQATPASLDETSIQFSWVHTIEFAGFYAAQEQGLYAGENLAVTLDGGGYNEAGQYIDPVQRVVNGEVDFGITDSGGILRARAAGLPIVGVATVYQRSPIVLISLTEKNITVPEDLVGKRIYVEEGTNVAATYEAFLVSQSIAHEDLVEIPKTDFTVEPLINDTVDVLPGFVTNEALQAKRRSEGGVNLILMSDYGIDVYANVIFTTEQMIQDNPDLVERFVRATVGGLQWTVDNPQAAGELVLEQYGEAMTDDIRAIQPDAIQASLPLIEPVGKLPGMMEAEVWEFTHQTLLDQGLLSEPIDWQAAYTTQFLDKIYAEQPAP